MAEPRIARLDEVASAEEIARLPYSLRVLLENVLRAGEEKEVRAVLEWQPGEEPHREMSFRPARVLLQDFTGVPAIVDLAAMRDAMRDLGGEAIPVRAGSFLRFDPGTTRCPVAGPDGMTMIAVGVRPGSYEPHGPF